MRISMRSDCRTMTAPVFIIALGCLIAGMLAGCTVGPDFHKPRVEAPAQWNEAAQKGVSMDASGVVAWWTLFRDRKLDSLIERAVAANLDLKVAEARIREARALRGVVASDLFPTINVSATYSRLRSSGTATPVVTTDGGADFAPSTEKNLFETGFDATWEIDVFGRIRRAVEAADADIASAEWDRRDVLITLLSEVARNYLELRGTQKRIAILKENIELQRKSLELTRGRLEAGLGNELDVAQAEALLTTTESQVPGLEAFVKQAIYSLGALLGGQPTTLLAELTEAMPIPPVPPEVPIGLPSELLRRRPDIRRAEMQLAAATARVGVATADLFPSFSLTGFLGLQSANIQDLLKTGSLLWDVGPTVSWPVFDAGRIRANIAAETAREEQSLVSYQNTVLVSLRDVESALVAYAKEQQTRKSLMASVDANQRAADISSTLYAQGLVDFLNVLVSQRALSVAQDDLVQSDQRVSTDLVAVFKALGGGWEISQ